MKRIPFALFSLMCLVGLAGCQCCGFGDRYADLIDDVSDHNLELDALYHPGLDLTRIGKPDWCRYRWNSILCRRACTAANCSANTCRPCPFCLEDEPSVYDVEPGDVRPLDPLPPEPTPAYPKLPPAPKPPDDPPPPGKQPTNPGKPASADGIPVMILNAEGAMMR